MWARIITSFCDVRNSLNTKLLLNWPRYRMQNNRQGRDNRAGGHRVEQCWHLNSPCESLLSNHKPEESSMNNSHGISVRCPSAERCTGAVIRSGTDVLTTNASPLAKHIIKRTCITTHICKHTQ
ncbi:unnamed protein product [Leuciscus chuanchicus]